MKWLTRLWSKRSLTEDEILTRFNALNNFQEAVLAAELFRLTPDRRRAVIAMVLNVSDTPGSEEMLARMVRERTQRMRAAIERATLIRENSDEGKIVVPPMKPGIYYLGKTENE